MYDKTLWMRYREQIERILDVPDADRAIRSEVQGWFEAREWWNVIQISTTLAIAVVLIAISW